jgi:predicted dienelactone hydrolase
LSWANDAQPERGNGRLVVISPGSGGSPWVHVDLARTLVARGFVVAILQHSGDNVLDSSSPGPESWVKRPREVGRAIDQIANDPRLSPMLSLDAVGIFGGSAGGHTALSLAGGAWSPARFRDLCLQHIEEDFSSCVGFTTLLRGTGWMDSRSGWPSASSR